MKAKLMRKASSNKAKKKKKGSAVGNAYRHLYEP